MTRRISRRAVLGAGAVAASVGVAGCSGVGSLVGQSPEEQVRDYESALERFTDVRTAIAEGYRTTGTYITGTDGALGVPFVNVGVSDLDPERPQAVLYTLTEDATYEAVGLKWFVPAEDRSSPPSLFGKTFSGPHTSDTSIIPEHYALHVWLYRENPDGLFARYNPALDPPDLVGRIAPVREALSEFIVGSTAVENGYTNTEMCIATGDGGYGVAFVRDGTDGSGGTDAETPPVLLYRLTENWTYQLMGAEWYVPAGETDDPPTLFGRPFHEPSTGHSPKTNQPEHYGLHAWLFRANPRGMFEPFNPTVSCGE
jgi:hypothetical protein